MKDFQYEDFSYRTAQIPHKYGEQVTLLSDVALLTLLAKLCSPKGQQPWLNDWIQQIYTQLLFTVLNKEFPIKQSSIRTRMFEHEPDAVYTGPVLDAETRVVCVNLARAGTLPSHVCYTLLNHILNPELIRQDHISISRKTNAGDQVTGSEVSGHKIGGSIDHSILIFPDPMGATGSTLSEVLDLYKDHGKPKKIISMHCIITPEFIRNVLRRHPETHIYAVRLDRGLSPNGVLKSIPGSHWDREIGLNAKQYIVPGGGGIGEVLNNSFV